MILKKMRTTMRTTMAKVSVSRVFFVVALASLSIIGLYDGLVYAATPSVFVPFSQPIGVAAAPGKLLVSEYCTGNVLQLDSVGTASPFATIPGGGGCVERYLAISPGLGGFTANHIYVTQGPQVWRVTPDGSSVTLFATIASPVSTHTGITFDHVGSFNNDMIVTAINGDVWRVNSSGTVTFVANVGGGVFIEGPDVAPLGFGPVGGQVLAASENTSNVYAVSNTGVVSVPFTWPSAESVHVIPPTTCSFGTSAGAFFTAIYPINITQFPPSDFTGSGGSVLVTSEGGGGIGLMSWNGTSFVTTTFQTNIGQHEGSAFVDCAVPSEKQGRMTGGGSIIGSVFGRVTHGFELHCDASQGPNSLQVNWGKGNKFHLEALTSVFCSDDPIITPNPPAAGFDTYKGKGTGRYNGVSGATVEWTFTDAGEPGTNDTAKIKITVGTTTVLSVSGTLNNGNHQAHKE